MKLAAFSMADDPDTIRVGIWTDDRIVDLTDRLPAPDVAYLAHLDPAALRELVVDAPGSEPSGVRLRAPLRGKGKVIAVGLNYHSHCREQGMDAPRYPMLFAILPNAINDPSGPIIRPRATDQLDAECELGVVIGRRVTGIGRGEARGAVFGYTVANDVSARDLQREDRQWMRAKSSDGFLPIGPWVVTADEVDLPVRLRTTVNGEVWQDESSADMIFDVAGLVAFASQTVTLEPGDLIITGTPAGVGHFQRPPRYLSEGDVVRCGISGIGVLENRVVDELPRADDHEAAAAMRELLIGDAA